MMKRTSRLPGIDSNVATTDPIPSLAELFGAVKCMRAKASRDIDVTVTAFDLDQRQNAPIS